MKYVVYKNDFNSSLKNEVIIIAPNENLSCEDILETLDSSLNAFIVDETDFPDSTNTAHLWEFNGSSIRYNITKVKEATKNTLRGIRAKRLSDLDVAYMKALEKGESTTAIIAEKQMLRDITQSVDELTTVEEMRTIISDFTSQIETQENK